MNFSLINVAHASERFDQFLANVNAEIINPLIFLLFALAVAFFLYGMLEFLFNQANGEKKTTGKSHMLWGIVGITIMMGVWMILGIILNTFQIEGINPEEGTVELPPYSPSSPSFR